MGTGWYDRSGKRLDDMDMLALQELLTDREYKVVGYTEFKDGTRVSTVWLGLDHRFGDGPPLIFETMVFPKDEWGELDCERYATIDEARAGHVRMVERWQEKLGLIDGVVLTE